MLLLLCILLNIAYCTDYTPPKIFFVTNKKYLMYNWEIYTCCNITNLIINKNNQTYLTIPVKEDDDYYCRGHISLPWCTFQYDPTNVYEWYISHESCNKTENKSKFDIKALDIYYATDTVNTYVAQSGSKTYKIIEVPHYKKSLENSCLNIFLKTSIYRAKPQIKIHNDVDTCDYKIFSNNYYIADLQNTYELRYDSIYTSNMTIGCTYSSQIGQFDVAPGKTYILEVEDESHHDIYIELQINPREAPNVYKLLTIIFGSIVIGITGLIILLSIVGLFMLYKKYSTGPRYAPINNDDIDDDIDVEIGDDNL